MSQEKSGNSRGMLLVGLAVLLIFLAFSLFGNPGCEAVVPQPTDPDKPAPLPPGKLSAYRQPWNSESAAHWPVAEPLSELSKIAYMPPEGASGAFLALGFTRTQHFSWGSMVAYVVTAEDVAVVVFRGTDDIPDWFVNLDAFSKETPHGSIHKGFSDAYDRRAEDISNAVKNSGARYVWITGHSLGGALAVVCSYDFIDEKKLEVTGLITFGQPMVARAELAHYLDKNLLGKYAHLVNESDIVARVPPTYTHCGSLVWFSDGKVYRSRQKKPTFGARSTKELDMTESDDLRPLTEAEFELQKQRVKANRVRMMALPDANLKVEGQLNVQGNLPFIDDHKMEHYVTKVRKYILNKDEETPAAFDASLELVPNQNEFSMEMKKGQILELRIADPALPQMVKDVNVSVEGPIKHLRNGRREDAAPGSKPVTGGGQFCIYLRVEGSGNATVSFSKTGMAHKKVLAITVR